MNSLDGSNNNDTLVGGADGADTLNGGSGNDLLTVQDADFNAVAGGNGTDTLNLSDAIVGVTLNFVNGIADGVVTGIEEIDITGGGDNGLVLDILDIQAITNGVNRAPDDPQFEGENTLVISGDPGDTLDLAGGFADTGDDTTVDGQGYSVFDAVAADGTTVRAVVDNEIDIAVN